jgi:hypothetical protein
MRNRDTTFVTGAPRTDTKSYTNENRGYVGLLALKTMG